LIPRPGTLSKSILSGEEIICDLQCDASHDAPIRALTAVTGAPLLFEAGTIERKKCQLLCSLVARSRVDWTSVHSENKVFSPCTPVCYVTVTLPLGW
jgi:hypothetical protein